MNSVKITTGISLLSQNPKIQYDEKSISRNHDDDFNTWYLFFQE